MVETRFISWSIHPWVLGLIGLYPLLFAFLFHSMTPEGLLIGILGIVFWVFFVTRGLYRWTQIYFWMTLGWFVFELIMAFSQKNIVAMVYGFVGVGGLLVIAHHLSNRFKRSYSHPQIQWFEGLPQFANRVKVSVFHQDTWMPAHLKVIDHYGIFIFMPTPIAKAKSVLVRLEYGEHRFEGDFALKSLFYAEWLGLGLQILPKDLYHFNQYGNLVRQLKGENYAI